MERYPDQRGGLHNLRAVRVNQQGLVLTRYLGGPTRLAWADITAVSWRRGGAALVSTTHGQLRLAASVRGLPQLVQRIDALAGAAPRAAVQSLGALEDVAERALGGLRQVWLMPTRTGWIGFASPVALRLTQAGVMLALFLLGVVQHVDPPSACMALAIPVLLWPVWHVAADRHGVVCKAPLRCRRTLQWRDLSSVEESWGRIRLLDGDGRQLKLPFTPHTAPVLHAAQRVLKAHAYHEAGGYVPETALSRATAESELDDRGLSLSEHQP
jgi:hypothetical protein